MSEEEEETNWDEYADGWDENDDVIRYANKAFASLEQLVLPHVSSLSTSRVLDFGCGTGLLVEKLAPLCGMAVAIDASPKMIEVVNAKVRATRLNHVSTAVCNLEDQAPSSIDVLRAPFDLIVASSVCAFLESFEGMVSTLKGMLNPGGWFVQWDWLPTEDSPKFGLSKDRVRAAYATAGLELVRAEPGFELEAGDTVMRTLMGIARAPE